MTISIALSKGRIFDETAPLLARVGIRPDEDPGASRKLVIGTNRRDLRLIVVRASDTPTYVQFGGADLGITPDIREDHAAYLGHWLKILKDDKRAIFSAAAHAQRAADFLQQLQPAPAVQAA